MNENQGINDSNYLSPIPYESTKKILNSMEKNVCKIFYQDKYIGTGFFCKLPIPDPSSPLPFLITNNSIINDNLINKGNEPIIITTRGEQKAKKTIILNRKKRLAFSFAKYGITFIEIKKNEITHFFDIDSNTPDYNRNNQDINRQVYMIQHKYINDNDNEVYVSFGILKKIEETPNYFNHTCLTFPGSSCSPIINLHNHKLIGIQADNVSGYFINNFKIDSSSGKTDYEYELNICHKGSSKDLVSKKKYTNGIDISEKKGFKYIGSNENRNLNSLIQILTSIEEIRNFLDPDLPITEEGKINNFERFDHIYILSSSLRKAILESYPTNKGNNQISLEPMNIILNFLNKDISHMNIYDFVLFVLNTLHEELISYPDNIPRTGKLISFNSQLNEIEKSKEQFNNYYSNQYFKSIISDLFNWKRREERFCSFCDSNNQNKKYAYSFQAFPIILFDLDEIAESGAKQKLYNTKPNSLKLQDIFNIYSLIKYKLDQEKEKCIFCGHGCLSMNYYIETSPKYFIIVINRKEKIGLTYDTKFELKDEEGKGIHYQYKKYELISVIIQEKNKSYCVVKNCEYDEITDFVKNKKSKFEEWIKFQDEKVSNINFEKNKNNYPKEIFDSNNAEILVYKGI